MDLKKIKKLSEKRRGGLTKVAADIGMSVPNLHRCINNNEIKASDLENLAKIFEVPVSYFFDEEEQPAPAKKRKGCGDAILSVAETLAGAPSREELQAKIDHLEEELASARRQMDINYRYITMLEQQLGIEQPTEKNTATA
ncbi:MAG: helix-turn-helix transcriptional regulator [Tidjanibacter sp.]|nr:helix-turn-helix transcriptional regulator [Tidjanibacter sp.]